MIFFNPAFPVMATGNSMSALEPGVVLEVIGLSYSRTEPLNEQP
jgi:hypothetical protein